VDSSPELWTPPPDSQLEEAGPADQAPRCVRWLFSRPARLGLHRLRRPHRPVPAV